MDTQKLRVRIGQHEFEAEGDTESVAEQFKIWREMVSDAPSAPTTPKAPPEFTPPPPGSVALETAGLRRLIVVNEKNGTISLAVHPSGDQKHADALLLLLLGYRRLQELEQVPVTKLLASMRQSGLSVLRVDRAIDPHIRSAYVLKAGMAKGSRYSLTNTGAARAEQIGSEIVAQMP